MLFGEMLDSFEQGLIKKECMLCPDKSYTFLLLPCLNSYVSNMQLGLEI